MQSKQYNLTSWGNAIYGNSFCFRPDNQACHEVFSDLSKFGLIAFGNGLNYGDMSINHNGHVCFTKRLNRIIELNLTTGYCHCEAGLTFAELNQITWPHNLISPVTPGTANVTLGGALANDIHGKNQHHQGCFASQVEGFSLLTAEKEIIWVTQQSHKDLFAATIGGVGLTGIILSVAFKLLKSSTYLEIDFKPMANIEKLIDFVCLEYKKNEYIVAWLDCLATGDNLGKGIVQIANQSNYQKPFAQVRPMSLPLKAPNWLLNRYSVSCFNQFYFHAAKYKGDKNIVSMQEFFYPLDKMANWNNLYGNRGLYQVQFVLPFEVAKAVIVEILTMINEAKQLVCLAVLKVLSKKSLGELSFSMPGISLALDFPGSISSIALIKRINAKVADNGGKIYLAKDACLDAELLRQMYNVDKFNQICWQHDPKYKLQSNLSRRLKLHIKDEG